jgi:5-methylcytosine-specific restriction endonuclease McrA
MPMDPSRYPKDWKAISLAVREAAGWKCEWCGAPNGEVIERDHKDPGTWWRVPASGEPDDPRNKTTLIVLTVAHLGTAHPDGTPGDKHDKHDVRRENLAALCQRCHLAYDQDDHVRNAAQTRRRKKIEAGQTAMEVLS